MFGADICFNEFEMPFARLIGREPDRAWAEAIEKVVDGRPAARPVSTRAGRFC